MWPEQSFLQNHGIQQQSVFLNVGYDGKSVQLHHCKGILNDIDDYIEIGSKAHTRFHQKYGYKNFINIRTVMDEF